MNWLIQLAKLEFGFHGIDKFPEIAIIALSKGQDTPSLRILAGLDAAHDDPVEIRNYLDMVMGELNIAKPTKEHLAWVLVEYIVDSIINNEITPHDGIHSLIWNVYNNMEWSKKNKEYAGDSIGIQVLYGLCDTYDDLLESTHCWDKNKTNEELLKEIEKKIYQATIEYKKQKFEN